MHGALIYFGSIVNEIIMIILDVGTWHEPFGLNCQKKKKKKKKKKYSGTFEMFFSCFGPFWVWGVTAIHWAFRENHVPSLLVLN